MGELNDIYEHQIAFFTFNIITPKVAKPLHQVAQGGVHYPAKTRTMIRYPPLQWSSPQQQAFY